MKYKANPMNGRYTCLKCGKEVEFYGMAVHSAWHKKKENEKNRQTKLI